MIALALATIPPTRPERACASRLTPAHRASALRSLRGAGSRRDLRRDLRNCGSRARWPSPTAREKTALRARSPSFVGENARQKILYEELHPYGSSAYRSSDSTSEVSARRYRYTGKERDEETGLDYFGARYYAPWLGRWTTADPLGLQAGLNLYLYGRASPVVMVDPNGMQEVPGANFQERMAREWSNAMQVLGGGENVGAENGGTAWSGPTLRGGILGGALRAFTLRLVPKEENQTKASAMGMDVGAGLVPYADSLMRAATGKTAAGEKTNQLVAAGEFLLEALPMVSEVRAALAEERAASSGLVLLNSEFSSAQGAVARGSGPVSGSTEALVAAAEAKAGIRGGAGSPWKKLGEKKGGATPQLLDESCGAACGEMVAGIPQAELIEKLGTEAVLPEQLSRALGPGWSGGVMPSEAADVAMMANKEPWIALMKPTQSGSKVGHFVVVEGQTKTGQMKIRDPAGEGSKYRMKAQEFLDWWTRAAVWKKQ